MRDTGTLSELGGEDITRQKGQSVACLGVGEMMEWLQTRTALPENMGSIPRTPHGKSEPSVTKVPEIKCPLWPCRHCMYMVHKHTCGRHSYSYNKMWGGVLLGSQAMEGWSHWYISYENLIRTCQA